MTRATETPRRDRVPALLALVMGACGAAEESETDAGAGPADGAGVWLPMSTDGAPETGADYASVWTGSEMFVWDGYECGSGVTAALAGLYEPAGDTWRPVSVEELPLPAFPDSRTAVWTGSEVILWAQPEGEDLPCENPPICDPEGRRYDPVTNTWSPFEPDGVPVGLRPRFGAWTGARLIVVGLRDTADGPVISGFSVDLAADASATPIAEQPVATTNLNVPGKFVWTGASVVGWGVVDDVYLYDPATDGWRVEAAPVDLARCCGSYVWAGDRVLGWTLYEVLEDAGGLLLEAAGGSYDPETGEWTPISTAGAPDALSRAPAVWTGSEMIVWGGGYNGKDTGEGGTGARYDPQSDVWVPLPAEGAPSARLYHVLLWTGSEMLVWGGCYGDGTGPRYGGGRFRP